MRRRASQDLNRIVKTNLKYQTKEFFNNSTLHGVRYIAEEGRSFSEKFMWFCFVSISAVSAFVIIASLWEKFQTNPTITGLDTDFHLPSLEFPSVTLCPEQPYNLTKVEETALAVGDHDSSVNAPILELLEVLSKLSYDNMAIAANITSKMSNQTQQQITKRYTLRELAFKVSKTCDSLFIGCKFRGEPKSCCEIFQPIYSERGFCYSFNQRYFGTANSEVRLQNFSTIYETDKSWSLELNLAETSNFYLHSVDEVFSYDNRVQFVWEPDSSIDILISMKQTYTTDDAAQLTIAQRKCIFPDQGEVQISYYNKDERYSLSSCMKECRMENAITLCKCIPPFYVPFKSRKDRRNCALQDFECLNKHARNITSIRRCLKCELSCLNTVYDIDKTSQTQGAEAKDSSRSVNIEFLTWPIIRYKREVLFGWVDLLVSFGGIAGLFLGFSLLSAVEIVYYFTVRASCMMFKNRQQLYELQAEKNNQQIPTYDLSMELLKFNMITKRSSIRKVEPVDSGRITRPSIENVEDAPSSKMKLQRVVRRINRSPNSNNSQYINDMQIPTQRQPLQKNGIFQPIPIAPYSQNIKPLDRNYRRPITSEEESDLVYFGYLP